VQLMYRHCGQVAARSGPPDSPESQPWTEARKFDPQSLTACVDAAGYPPGVAGSTMSVVAAAATTSSPSGASSSTLIACGLLIRR